MTTKRDVDEAIETMGAARDPSDFKVATWEAIKTLAARIETGFQDTGATDGLLCRIEELEAKIERLEDAAPPAQAPSGSAAAAETRAELIARLAPGYEECEREEAEGYESGGGRYQRCLTRVRSAEWTANGMHVSGSPWSGAEYIWLRKTAPAPTPAPGAIPAGFSACEQREATPGQGSAFTGRLGMRDGRLSFWTPSATGVTWLRPSAPDAEKLARAIATDIAWGESEDAFQRLLSIVRRALERIRQPPTERVR